MPTILFLYYNMMGGCHGVCFKINGITEHCHCLLNSNICIVRFSSMVSYLQTYMVRGRNHVKLVCYFVRDWKCFISDLLIYHCVNKYITNKQMTCIWSARISLSTLNTWHLDALFRVKIDRKIIYKQRVWETFRSY